MEVGVGLTEKGDVELQVVWQVGGDALEEH